MGIVKCKLKTINMNIGIENTQQKPNKQHANLYIIIAVLCIFLINVINCDERPEVVNPSVILYEFSKVVLELSAIEEEVRNAFLEKPLNDLIKSHLEPIEEEVAGLNVNISKLEKMESPKELISITITQLETLAEKIYFADHILRQIVDESNRKRDSVVARYQNIFKFEEKISDIYNSEEGRRKFTVLDAEGLNFQLVMFSDEELMEMQTRNMTFSKTGVILEEAGFGPKVLAAKLLKLSKLMDRRTEFFERTTEGFKAMGAKNFVEGFNDPLKREAIMDDPVLGPHLEKQSELCWEIVENIEEEFLNLTVNWVNETAKVIEYLMDAVMETEVNVKLYLEIRNNIMDDSNELKKRMEKLEHLHAHEEL